MKANGVTPTGAVIIDDKKTSQVTPEKKMEKEVELGSIEGTLGYPAGGIPKLEVYAFDSSSLKNYFMVETAVNHCTALLMQCRLE